MAQMLIGVGNRHTRAGHDVLGLTGLAQFRDYRVALVVKPKSRKPAASCPWRFDAPQLVWQPGLRTKPTGWSPSWPRKMCGDAERVGAQLVTKAFLTRS
jgi:hypothetical protein